MTIARRPIALAGAALAAVALIKLAVLLQLGSHPLLQPEGELDAGYYAHFAARVASGDVWLADPESFFGRGPAPFFLAPLYVYVLAACLEIGGGALDVARVVQGALGVFAVALLAATARRWYGRRAAWATGATAALCGLFSFYEVLILQASLEPVLTALDLYTLTRAAQDGRKRWWLATGAALGVHALNRPNMIIVAVGLCAVLLLRSILRARRRTAGVAAPAAWTAPALLVLATAVAIAPATIRNWRVTGEFVPIASHGGLNFLAGNGPTADGTFTRVMGIEPSIRGQWIEAGEVVAAALGRPASSSETSAFFTNAALDWIRQHPTDEAALLLRKAWYVLSADFLPLNYSYPFYAKDLVGPLSWLVIGPWLIVPLGLMGLVVARPRDRPGYAVWAAYVPLAAVSVVVFFVASRYRLPFQIALTVAAGGGAVWLWDAVSRRAWRPLAGAAAGLVGLAALVIWPTGLDDGRAEERVRMGLADMEAGRTAEGEAWIARGVERHRTPGVVHVRAGQALESAGRLSDAIAHYRQAAEIDPGEPAVQFALGRALYSAGQFAPALTALERAGAGPQAGPARRLTELALLRLGRRAEAEQFHRLQPVDTWSAGEARAFARELADAGRPDLSIDAWRRATVAGGEATDFEQLGGALVLAGRHLEALPVLEQAAQLAPRAASMHLNYAIALSLAGQNAEARREAEIALTIDPAYEKASQLLRVLRAGR